MSRKRGRMVYVPKDALFEVKDIMEEESFDKRSEAWRKMVEHCKVGREVERITRLDFRKRKKRDLL